MPSPSPQRIINLANAFYKSQTLFTASDAGIFSFLSANPASDLNSISSSLELDQRAARLLLDSCVAIELLEKNDDKYSNTKESEIFLVENSPADLSKAIRYNRDVYSAWGKVDEFLKSGQPVEKPEIHLGTDKERTRAFVLSMHGRAMAIGQAVVPMLDLSGCKNLLDLGGGPGTYSRLIAKNNPDIHCTMIDLPAVAEIAQELTEQENMTEQVTITPGSYRECEFPSGMDAVIFFGVLHQESPESIQKLFKKAYSALNRGGKIFVMDMMTDATRTAPEFSALFALNMALTTDNGWVFSDEDTENWLEEAGFNNFSVSQLAPPMPHWLASATKA